MFMITFSWFAYIYRTVKYDIEQTLWENKI